MPSNAEDPNRQRLSSLSVEGREVRSSTGSLGSRASIAKHSENAMLSHVGVAAEKITFSEACMTLAINCIGAGVTTFPNLVANVGWGVAPILCAVCALCCYECGNMICLSCEMVEERLGLPCDTYEDLASAIGGRPWLRILVLTKNFAMLGFIIVYLQLVYESLQSYAGDKPSAVVKAGLRYGLVLPVFAMLSMMKELKTLTRFASLGLLAVGVEVGGLIIGGIDELYEIPVCNESSDDLYFGRTGSKCRWYAALPVENDGMNISSTQGSGWTIEGKGEVLGPVDFFSQTGVALSVFLFTYAILATIPAMRASLAEPKRMPTVIFNSFAFCVLVNWCVMLIGYYGFGQNSPPNAIIGLHDDFPLISGAAAAAIIVNLIFSTPLYSYCVISYIESTGEDAWRTAHTVPNLLFRFSLILLLTVASDFLPYVMQVIGLVSSIFACCNNMFFPCYFYYKIRKQTSFAAVAQPSIRWILHVFVMIVAIVVFIFGVRGSVVGLLKAINKDALAAKETQ